MNREQNQRLLAIYDAAVEKHLLGDSEFFTSLAKVTDVAERKAMLQGRVDAIKAQLQREAREAFGN